MDGVDFNKGAEGSLSIRVNGLSDDLKKLIRANLSEVCNGVAKAARNPILYSYKLALEAFIQKYDKKKSNTQKGMIGELLTHLLLLHFEEKFRAVSPYFNMEEDAIKKGFDLVLHDKETSKIWFVEVKSGDCGPQSCSEKLGNLLSVAKTDLKTSLDSSRNTLWQNAVNGASLVIENTDLKAQIQDILEEYNQKAVEDKSKSSDYNALLVATCFGGGKNFATTDEFDHKHKYHKGKAEFGALISLSIQKDTYQSITSFLRDEVSNE